MKRNVHCSITYLKSEEPLLKAVRISGLLSASETKKDFIQHQQLERLTRYSQKSLHGYFVRLCDSNFDEIASVYWLTKGDLSAETKGFLIAAQDQALKGHYGMFSLLILCCNAGCVICKEKL